MEDKRERHALRVAELYGLSNAKEGAELYRMFASLRKVSNFVDSDSLDAILKDFLEKIYKGEPIMEKLPKPKKS
jgi:hypothetical protein